MKIVRKFGSSSILVQDELSSLQSSSFHAKSQTEDVLSDELHTTIAEESERGPGPLPKAMALVLPHHQ